MASTDPEERPRGSAEFVESSVLEAVVPLNSSIDIEEELKSWDGSVEDENSSIIPFLSQRQFLLFDELVPVYIILRTPIIPDATIRSYLARLAINVESFAISTAPNPETSEANAPLAKELIYSETIKGSYEPVIISYENEASPHVYVVWKIDVFICRPRGRLQKPAIYFAPAASLKPPERAKRPVLEDEYLPSRVPTALNLLQPFENDPALAGSHPRLSALRISKIAPTAPVAKELIRPIRSGLRRLFRVAPAVIWRMRYSKWQSSLNDMALIASLDLEIAHFTSCDVEIEDINFVLQSGRVEPYVDNVGKGRPMLCSPGDQTTLLYKLIPDSDSETFSAGGNTAHVLDLKITAKLLASPECRPNLSIEWRTTVDFSMGSSTSFGRAAHLLGRPISQAMISPSKAPGPDSLPHHDELSPQEESDSNEINISLTISGPSHVQLGNIFHWDVFIVNRSNKTRKLAVLVIPKRKRDLERHKSQPSTSSAGGRREDKENLLATAVLDDNIVYAKQKNARLEPAELVSLTTDVRIGHLGPGACYTAELKFLALSRGVLSVEALRIVDLATQEAVDIRDLPSVVAQR